MGFGVASNFPVVDRNRLVSNASKTLLEATIPSTWQVVHIGGDADFGLDVLVQLAVDGGVQHLFFIQLKGTESPDFVDDGGAISYPLKRRTLNLYANLVPEVMLAIATVVLDEADKLDIGASKIYWQWMSRELRAKRGSQFELDLSQGKTTTVHVPCAQVLHSRLDVGPHLQKLLDIARAGMSLEDILRQVESLGVSRRPSALGRFADIAQERPREFSAWFESEGGNVRDVLPPIANEIKTLIRAGNTEQAEEALKRLGPEGFGGAPSQKAAYLTLQGKTLVQRRNRSEALKSFEGAYALDATEENLLPLAETRFLLAVDTDDIDAVCSIRTSLAGVESNDGLALRVRVHVTLKEFSEAEQCLCRISESKRLIPRLVFLSAQRKWNEVIALANSAELDATLSLADLTSSQLISARAAWCGATEDVALQGESDELPLFGAVGTRIDLAREAWQFGLRCLRGLRTLGWTPNVELIAPVLCGVSGMLGHQREALRLLGGAAEQRPEYEDLQRNVELLAIGAGEAEQALAANLRQEDSIDVLTRRVSTLFELRRFAECEATALALARSGPSERIPMALAIGYAAANRVGHLLEAAELYACLSSTPEWGEFLCFAEFARLANVQPGGEEPLAALRNGLAQHPDSWLLASNLYSNLVVNEVAPAREAVELAKLLRKRTMLSLDDLIRLVAAHTTLNDWDGAAREAAGALERFTASDRLLAMGAVAEEMRGRTGTALAMLERALEVGTDRISVIHNYMGLTLRLGRIDSVRTAIDRLLGLVTDRTERLELMRLSALIYVQQGRFKDAIAAVEGLGQLVNQLDEQEEGVYINLALTTTVNGPPVDESLQQAFSARVNAFCARWPDSKLFRRMEMPEDSISGLDDLHRWLEPFVGDSRTQLREFEQRERQAQRGEFLVPFAARPGFVLHYIGDPFHLWEVAIRSRPEDRQFHLLIAGRIDEPKSPNAARDIPLLDLTALLVLDSLGIFDKLFLVFERIAISRSTVGFVSQHANGVLAYGASMDRAKSILGNINRRLDRIDQPRDPAEQLNSVLSAMDVIREYVHLATRGAWLLYCDDAICRMMVHAESHEVRSCTTIDVLALLDTNEDLTAPQVAAKLAQLAEWNVGITVADRYLIASLVGSVSDGCSGDASYRVDAFHRNDVFGALSRAIWHPGKRANELVAHMARLLHSMLQSPKSDIDSVAAVLASWFLRVRLLQKAESSAWGLLCYPVLLVMSATPNDFGGRLIGVLQRAASAIAGERMSVTIEGEVATELGVVVALLAKQDRVTGEELLRKLLLAMPSGTADGDSCMEGYMAEINLSANTLSS